MLYPFSLQSRPREIKAPEVCSVQEPDALVMAQYAWHRSNRSVVADGLDPSGIWRTIWNVYRHEVGRGTHATDLTGVGCSRFSSK